MIFGAWLGIEMEFGIGILLQKLIIIIQYADISI
jgi:hypothetical protein